MENLQIIDSDVLKRHTKDNVVDLVLNTIAKDKQVLIFNNSKNSSEATAEKIADAINKPNNERELLLLSNKILKSLQNPTKQCKRLAKCVQKGIAFHHSGLVAKQRTLIENEFKNGLIKAISSTPTLAAGLNLPAYKVIVKDYKRYSQRGFNDIPVLEYHQMSGRAGRPGKEDIGRAVLCVKSEEELNRVIPKFIFGESEEIISKLAVEPTLKMHILSLVSMDMINAKKEIKDFFKNTLYAEQYQDLEGLYFKVFDILKSLKSYGFVDQEDDYYRATRLGKKVSELYLNPDTADYFLSHLVKFQELFTKERPSSEDIYQLIHFVSNCAEMRPLFRILKAEEDVYTTKIEEMGDEMLVEFDPFEMDYANYMSLFKTADIFQDWINEAPEDYISEKYKITPGELTYKLGRMDWLLYCLEEFSLLKKNHFFKNVVKKLRIRFKAGVKEELISFVTLKGIGRARARKLYKANLKSFSDLSNASFEVLSKAVGDSMAIKIREQLTDEKYTSNDKVYSAKKPKEIKVRDVTDEEVDELVGAHVHFEKEKQESQKGLLDYF